jgi:hypothetical protein
MRRSMATKLPRVGSREALYLRQDRADRLLAAPRFDSNASTTIWPFLRCPTISASGEVTRAIAAISPGATRIGGGA